MRTIKNPLELLKAQTEMENELHNIIETIAEEVLQKWKDTLTKRIYEDNMLKKNPSNDYYTRSRDMINSLTIKWIDNLNCELDYDTNLIYSNFLGEGMFNQHMGFNGQDVSEFMPDIIEAGQNSRIYSHDGVNAQEDVVRWLQTNFRSMLQRELKSRKIL